MCGISIPIWRSVPIRLGDGPTWEGGCDHLFSGISLNRQMDFFCDSLEENQVRLLLVDANSEEVTRWLPKPL
jgi:hypothetical protein